MQQRARHVTLVVGGVRSGKSSFAQKLAMHASSVGYIATAQASDAEMLEKIARHRRERPAVWSTVEEPLYIDRALIENDHLDLLLLDCLTVFAANLLMADAAPEVQELQLLNLCQALSKGRASVVIVSNEVGSGVVPPYPLGRAYRDFLGELNQRVAAIADNVILMVAGLPLVLKGKVDHLV